MRNIVKVFSLALIVLLSGCGKDRAGNIDSNGVYDYQETVLGTSTQNRDSNSNGIIDNGNDHDGDGISDENDLDDDNDRIPDTIDNNSTNFDSDGDGIPDGADADIDGDGHLDNGNDSDGDGINDDADVDVNGDGIIDNGTDSDGDGINDKYDTIDNRKDRDNDGLPDGIDPNDYNYDTDGDGIPDGADVDIDGDGIDDNGVDSDGDGVNDNSDVDIDGDGKADNGIDSDGDGINSEHDTIDNTKDSDYDGLPDDIDINNYNYDSDGDGIPDGVDVDVNGDGINDNGIDSDRDGINDLGDIDNHPDSLDSDGDGIIDEYDIDDDNDGISDIDEIAHGTNPLLADSDGDGKSDKDEGIKDSDGDGLIDALDSSITDSDNDGVFDELDSNNTDPINDSDGDGQANIKELNCTEGDPLDANKSCPWATDTPYGKAMASAGFIYITGGFDVDGDGIKEKGFWTSAYQARESGIEINANDIISTVDSYNAYIQNNFILENGTQNNILGYTTKKLEESPKGYMPDFNTSNAIKTHRMTNIPPFLALASMSKYIIKDSKNNIISKNLSLLTQKQYIQIMKLLQADKESGGDGHHIHNNILGVDIEVPLINYSTVIYEFGTEYKEFLSNLIWVKDDIERGKFSIDDIKSWWGVDIDNVLYNHKDGKYGANSIMDVGFGAGVDKDNYAVVARGGSTIDLLQGTAGVDTDRHNLTNGIGFRVATSYLP